MICWDLWDFRNNVLHAPAGPLAVARHYRLNQDIEEEFALGTANLKGSLTTLYFDNGP